MGLVNADYSGQRARVGLEGRRVSVEVDGKVVKGRVKSLAGSTRGGVGIYLVRLDRGGVLPFTRDSFAVDQALDDWGFKRHD